MGGYVSDFVFFLSQKLAGKARWIHRIVDQYPAGYFCIFVLGSVNFGGSTTTGCTILFRYG